MGHGALFIGVAVPESRMIAKDSFTVLVVPGGGLHEDTDLPAVHVQERLSVAIPLFLSRFVAYKLKLSVVKPLLICLSLGTPHKLPNIVYESETERNQLVLEGPAGCKYVMRSLHSLIGCSGSSSGIDCGFSEEAKAGICALLNNASVHDILLEMSGCVLEEASSWDTIGNAFFLRSTHLDVLGARSIVNITIITSNWHMERTETIFRHVMCSVEPRCLAPEQLSFISSGNGALAGEALLLRLERERCSASTFIQETAPLIPTMSTLHQFLFKHHLAYSSKRWILRLETDSKAEEQRHSTSKSEDEPQRRDALMKSY